MKILFTQFSLALILNKTYAQTTAPVAKDTVIIEREDTVRMKSYASRYDPRKALLLAAIVPGLGQAYNKKYWKIPLVYGALGVTGAIFVYNLKNYRELRFAYQAKYKASLPGATAIAASITVSLRMENFPAIVTRKIVAG